MPTTHPFRLWVDASGYSVREIARQCSVTRSAVYNWCCGSSAPSVQHLAVLHRLSHGAVQPWFWTTGGKDADR